MEEDFVKLFACGTEGQAELLRQILVDGGIPSGIKGSSKASALAMGGANSGGIFVLVPENRVSEATAILDSLYNSGDAPSWQCGSCGEFVDSGFDVCWACQAPREESGHAPSSPASAIWNGEGNPFCTRSQDSGPLPQDRNPYAAVALGKNSDSGTFLRADFVSEAEEGNESEVDGHLRRAFRAAVISLVLFPLPLFPYSVYLLLKIAFSSEPLTPSMGWRYLGTWLVVFVVAFAWAVMLVWLA